MTMVFLSVSAQGVDSFVKSQLAEYPEMRLLDIYKSCFQDFMGPEHLVSDTASVRRYLDYELGQMDGEAAQDWYFEPCGTKGRYVRVNLRAVKENLISEETLVDAFIRSANGKHPEVRKWERRWHKIVRKIDKMRLGLPFYDDDKRFIDEVLSSGKYAISHSPDYREAYHPHYRIVERSIFEMEIKPFLTPTFVKEISE